MGIVAFPPTFLEASVAVRPAHHPDSEITWIGPTSVSQHNVCGGVTVSVTLEGEHLQRLAIYIYINKTF